MDHRGCQNYPECATRGCGPHTGEQRYTKGKHTFAEPEVFTYETSELKDLVNHYCEWTKNKKIKHRTKQQLVSEVLTEEQMAELDQYLGNALGKVTVGGELTHSKEFGCSAKAFVSISVTCDGSLETCQTVHDITQPVTRALINEDVRMMMQDRDQILAEVAPQTQASPQGRVAAPAGRPAPRSLPSFRR